MRTTLQHDKVEFGGKTKPFYFYGSQVLMSDIVFMDDNNDWVFSAIIS